MEEGYSMEEGSSGPREFITRVEVASGPCEFRILSLSHSREEGVKLSTRAGRARLVHTRVRRVTRVWKVSSVSISYRVATPTSITASSRWSKVIPRV